MSSARMFDAAVAAAERGEVDVYLWEFADRAKEAETDVPEIADWWVTNPGEPVGDDGISEILTDVLQRPVVFSGRMAVEACTNQQGA